MKINQHTVSFSTISHRRELTTVNKQKKLNARRNWRMDRQMQVKTRQGRWVGALPSGVALSDLESAGHWPVRCISLCFGSQYYLWPSRRWATSSSVAVNTYLLVLSYCFCYILNLVEPCLFATTQITNIFHCACIDM